MAINNIFNILSFHDSKTFNFIYLSHGLPTNTGNPHSMVGSAIRAPFNMTHKRW